MKANKTNPSIRISRGNDETDTSTRCGCRVGAPAVAAAPALRCCLEVTDAVLINETALDRYAARAPPEAVADSAGALTMDFFAFDDGCAFATAAVGAERVSAGPTK